MGGFAWVTLATNDSYSLGALVLAHSLRRAGTVHQIAVLITPGVTPSMREKLGAVFDSVTEVNVLDSKDAANLALLARPDLGITFTKLHCWRLTQYDKCCFLDADTLVVENCDELSEREELSAAPDVGWPDCFNSGVFVFKPSLETFKSLMGFALQFGSFDGGDQGLLNLYFKDWAHKDISKHLPFIYNMCSTACYSYLPAFKQFGSQVKIVHFIGASKPWICYLDSESKEVQAPREFTHVQPLLQFWWDLFCQNVHSSLSPSMAGLAGALAHLTLGAPRSDEQTALEDQLRRQAWEQGHIDYMGKDSFDNIWSRVLQSMGETPEPEAAPTPAAAVAPVPAQAPAAAPAPAPAAAPAPSASPAPAPAPAAAPASPPTPTVTSATPPTSPPVSAPPQPQPSPEALKVDPTPPGTPPVGASGAEASEPLDPNAPIPPKRKGSGPSKGKK